MSLRTRLRENCKRAAAGVSGSLAFLSQLGLETRGAVISINPPCPWLPDVGEILDFSVTRRHGGQMGARFYLDALRYAQSQWVSGKPAQAILQLNKAWMADLPDDDPVFENHPSPYRALVWILETASSRDSGFLGNPVRHFQHLASRMSGPRADIRAWRAWLCFHLAEQVLDPAGYPRDWEQIVREGLWIPGFQRALREVRRRSVRPGGR